MNLLFGNVFRHHFEFEYRSFSDEVDGFLGVLYSGKFNQYPVVCLRPNIRLTHPELVDPVADSLKALAYCHGPKIVNFLLVHGQKHPRPIRRGFR